MSMIAHTGAGHGVVPAAGVLVGGLYVLAWRRLSDRRASSLIAIVTAVGLIIALGIPWAEDIAARSFTGHMAEHLVTIVVVAPLVVWARPLDVALRSGFVPRTARLRRWTAAGRGLAPMAAAMAFVVVLFGTHLTGIYDRALGDPVLHEVEHGAYLLSAVALWSALLTSARGSAPVRLAAVFAVIGGMALLGMILMSADEATVAAYAERLGPDALDDQRTAAALMWVTGMATTLPLVLAGVWKAATAEQRRAHRLETLDPTR